MKQPIRWKLVIKTAVIAASGILAARTIWLLFFKFQTAPASTTPSICIEMHSGGTIEHCPHKLKESNNNVVQDMS